MPLVFFCCKEPKNTNIKDKDRITVTGSFPDDIDISSFSAVGLSQDGLQSALLEYHADAHNFSFALNLNSLIKSDTSGIIERITSMGRSITPDDFSPGDFAQMPLGFSRVHIWGDIDKEKQTLSLYDGLIPVPRSAVLSGKESIPLGRVYAALSGYADVKVFDSGGLPIEGARVAIINLDSTRPIRLWDQKDFPPGFVLTDADGLATSYGINTNGSEPNFQVFAYKEGFCPYVTFPRVYDAQISRELSLYLDSCDATHLLAGEIEAFFGDDINTRSVQNEAFGTADVAQLSGTEITLRLRPLNIDLRPLTLNVYEGYEATGTVLTQKVLNTFSSEITLDIPALFSDGSANGTFTIEIISRRNTSDYAQGELKPLLLYGQKNTTKPLLLGTMFTVKNELGTENIISGLGESNFSIEVPTCSEGESIALLDELQVDSQNADFFSCEEGSIILAGDSISYDLAETGYKKMKFFLKDIFGNISADDPDTKENRRTIYVDFSAPDLDAHPLVVDKTLNNLGEFGFAPKTAAKGTNSVPYIFDNTLFITPNTVGSFVLRFSRPSKCILIEPGSGGDGIDNQVAWFDFALEGEPSDPLSTGALCGEDLFVESGDIMFPTSASDNATLRLKVFDAAGNISAPAIYQVLPCPQSGSQFEFCWKNDV